MSGHNPHGRLGQPLNPSWNHLQVPSFIGRQPQLAHMSNERPLMGPLGWPPVHSAETLYAGYMAVAAAASAASAASGKGVCTEPMLAYQCTELSIANLVLFDIFSASAWFESFAASLCPATE